MEHLKKGMSTSSKQRFEQWPFFWQEISGESLPKSGSSLLVVAAVIVTEEEPQRRPIGYETFLKVHKVFGHEEASSIFSSPSTSILLNMIYVNFLIPASFLAFFKVQSNFFLRTEIGFIHEFSPFFFLHWGEIIIRRLAFDGSRLRLLKYCV